MSLSRFIIITITSSLLLTGCSFLDEWVYRPDINQGNYVTQEAVDLLKVGQTREQVVYIMGTPMLTSVYGDNVWYYVFREKPQHSYVRQKTYTIIFNQLGRVAEIKNSAYNESTLYEMDGLNETKSK